MNQFCCYLPIKPISYNESHTVVGHVLRSSTEMKRFKRDALKLLTQFSKQIKAFANTNGLSPIYMRIIFWVPMGKLITKSGNISHTSIDIDNVQKGLIDVVFKKITRFNPNMDDAQVVKLISEKRISPTNTFGASVHMMTWTDPENIKETA